MASRPLPLTKSDVVNLTLYSAVQPSVKVYTVHKKAARTPHPQARVIYDIESALWLLVVNVKAQEREEQGGNVQKRDTSISFRR
jgi:hypothetical protein